MIGKPIAYERGELKPCPFCGGKARLTFYFGYSPSYGDWSTNTYSCGCYNCDIHFDVDWDKDRAVKLWNNRV